MTLAVPPDVIAARTLTDAFDVALGAGFARLSNESRVALDDLAAAVAGTPLGDLVGQAVAALAAGELLAHHLAAIAAARAALEGAAHDALLALMADTLGLVVETPEAAPTPKPDAVTHILMESARQWLVEIALAGLGQLDHGTIAPAIGALRPLQESPALRRLAALMTGFAHELIEAAPTAAAPELPLRRWADLWSTAMLATFALPAAPTRRSVSGLLTPLGVDVRHHDQVVSFVVHALFDDGTPRLVKTTLSAWKVDAVTGAEVYSLLAPLAPELMAALTTPHALQLTGATLLSSGDLLWDGAATKAAGDPFMVDLKGAIVTAPLPRDRHVMQLALPVTSAVAPLDTSRTSAFAEIDPAELAKATGLIGLLRYDDGFSVQPLAFAQKKKLRGPADAFAASLKLKERAVTVLQERASRLLRKS